MYLEEIKDGQNIDQTLKSDGNRCVKNEKKS